MTNYSVTIGYRAVITVSAKAENEAEAKKLAVEIFKKQRDRIKNHNVTIEDDNFKADGCVDMDATWNMYDK